PPHGTLQLPRLVFPVCAVPGGYRPTSWASQIDHIQQYHHTHPENGGKTEIANLHPLCWRHHQMKTAGLLDPIKESITHAVTRAITTPTPHRENDRSTHADGTPATDQDPAESAPHPAPAADPLTGTPSTPPPAPT